MSAPRPCISARSTVGIGHVHLIFYLSACPLIYLFFGVWVGCFETFRSCFSYVFSMMRHGHTIIAAYFME